MCEPTTIALVASAVVSGVSMYSQKQQAQAQAKAINKQNELQAEEINRQHGVEMSERARAARRERASARVLAGEAGINLGSNSFLAQLQTSAMNQYNDMGLILQNEKSQQAARHAGARSALASIYEPSWGEIAIGAAASGVKGYMAAGGTFGASAGAAPTPTGGTGAAGAAPTGSTRGYA